MAHASLPRAATALKRGFTLIELLAVTAIIGIISTIVLANNNKFGGSVLLQNLAYDIALTVRQSQVYGISVRGFNGTFSAAYGMHFQVAQGSAAPIYVLFADLDNNGIYNSGELVQSTTVGQGYLLTGLCVTPPSGSEQCGTSLDITFKRPDPDACISINGSSPMDVNGNCTGGAQSARIEVTSPQNQHKNIIVEVNGQISVQ